MQALRAALAGELAGIERDMQELEQSELPTSANLMAELRVCSVTRAALYSGLASIKDVLGRGAAGRKKGCARQRGRRGTVIADGARVFDSLNRLAGGQSVFRYSVH